MTDFGEKAMIASQVIMTTTMVVNNLVSAIQSIRDPDVSGWEAFKGILGSFITTIPMVISLLVSLHNTFGSVRDAASAMWAAIGGFTDLAIAGVVALSAALIGFLAYNSYKNSPEQQLKRISKASEEAKEGLEDAKKAYQDLQQNLSDLDNGIDAISEMTRGTVEWRNAINDSNDSLIKLLSTYGKLSSTNYTIDSDGLMHLKDGVKEELEQIAQDYVDTAQMASYAMQKMQYKAQQAVDDKEAEQVLKDNTNHYESYGNGEAVDTADFLADSAMQTLADSINDASADFVNNAYKGHVDEFFKYYTALIERELDNGTPCVIITPVLQTQAASYDFDKRQQVMAYAEVLHEIGKLYGIPVIDGSDFNRNFNGNQCIDFTHMTNDGNNTIGKEMAALFIAGYLGRPLVVEDGLFLSARTQ